MALLWWNLIGVGVTDKLLHHPMPGYLIQLLIKGQNFHKDVHIWGSTEEKKGGTLNSFFFVLFLFLWCFCTSLAFLCFCFVLGVTNPVL